MQIVSPFWEYWFSFSLSLSPFPTIFVIPAVIFFSSYFFHFIHFGSCLQITILLLAGQWQDPYQKAPGHGLPNEGLYCRMPGGCLGHSVPTALSSCPARTGEQSRECSQRSVSNFTLSFNLLPYALNPIFVCHGLCTVFPQKNSVTIDVNPVALEQAWKPYCGMKGKPCHPEFITTPFGGSAKGAGTYGQEEMRVAFRWEGATLQLVGSSPPIPFQ